MPGLRAVWASKRIASSKCWFQQSPQPGEPTENGSIVHPVPTRETAARVGVRLEVAEAVLNHISGSRGGIAGVYQRHDWAAEKRAALDAWAAHVLAVAEGRTPADNVVKLAHAS